MIMGLLSNRAWSRLLANPATVAPGLSIDIVGVALRSCIARPSHFSLRRAKARRLSLSHGSTVFSFEAVI